MLLLAKIISLGADRFTPLPITKQLLALNSASRDSLALDSDMCHVGLHAKLLLKRIKKKASGNPTTFPTNKKRKALPYRSTCATVLAFCLITSDRTVLNGALEQTAVRIRQSSGRVRRDVKKLLPAPANSRGAIAEPVWSLGAHMHNPTKP